VLWVITFFDKKIYRERRGGGEDLAFLLFGKTTFSGSLIRWGYIISYPKDTWSKN
jgi:hypothetical protein